MSSRYQKLLFSLGIICLLGVSISLTGLFHPSRSIADHTPCVPGETTPIANHNSQIIGTFPCVTYTPTPRPTATPVPQPTRPPIVYNPPPIGHPAPPTGGNECAHFQPAAGGCSCNAGYHDDNCRNKYQTANDCTAAGGLPGNQGADCFFPKGQAPCSNGVDYCMDKPVIYLYPTKPTMVSVKVTLPGHVTISDPLYPSDGWKDVLANPNGQLLYKGKSYHELFYESSLKNEPIVDTSFTISSQDLLPVLSNIIERLGLISSEKAEFLSYWIPRLENLHSHSISISLLLSKEMEQVDHIAISPQPDTFIKMLFIFTPTNSNAVFTSSPSLPLPSTPPQRHGFTAVEWGGMVVTK